MSKSGIQFRGESAGAPASSQTDPSFRILAVDDDANILRLHANALRSFGYQTEIAEDGDAAWEMLQAKDYDLLITDHDMPKITGLELLRKVRSARLPLRVIMASGQLPEEELDRNPWLQPLTTLAKPFSMSQLLDTVNEALEPSTETFFSHD